MAGFCIPPVLAQKLKESALKGEVNIKELYNMNSKERRDFFSKHTNKDLGKMINSEFEKAMVSKQQTAIADWAQSVFSPKMKKQQAFKSTMDKIENLKESGVLDPKAEEAFLEDLVSDKLGLNVTPEQVKVISEKAKKIDEAQIKLGEDFGNPLKAEENLNFFKAKMEMDKYLQSLNPASNLRIVTGTIGRGMMLASIKSPVLNIGSNIEVGFLEALSRRISNFSLKGADNNLAKQFVKMSVKIYKETGYDISRMTSLKDLGLSGERVLGDTVHAQGAGGIKRVGRVVEDVVFKNLMGFPDAVFGATHFADSVNLNALKFAKGDKALAKKIMIDAMRLEPTTSEGKIVRMQGVLDAQVATWTDSSWASRTSEGIRGILNDVSGDLRIGDYLMPFVKTPANVIATGMDYAGFGIPKALYKTVKAFKTGDLKSREYISGMTRDLVRSGFGMTAAAILSAYVDPKDFVGAYDPNRAQYESLRNSNTNSFKIGNKWISVDWLGPISIPFSAMMYAKKYGGTGSEKTFQYSKGVLSQVQKLPGIQDSYDFYKTQSYKKGLSLEEMVGQTGEYIISEAGSRLMPSFISDIAKASDPYDRKSTTAWEAVKKKIPGLRQTLPIKTNIFGEKVETEPAWSVILFGSRVKTDKSTAITEELYKISEDTGKNINFTDWDKASSKKLLKLKKELGPEKYNALKIEYGNILRDKLGEIIKNSEYKDLDSDEKINGINSLDSKIIDKLIEQSSNS